MSEKYANKENLERFWDKAKEYIGNERQEIEDQLYNWQKTEKAPAVQCEPVPNSELHPIVEFMFKETLPEGEKGPENPSVISGINSIKIARSAENIITYEDMYVSSALTSMVTAQNDGSILINGTIPTGGGFVFRKNGTYGQNSNVVDGYSTFIPEGTYRIGLKVESGSLTFNSGYVAIRFSCKKNIEDSTYIYRDGSVTIYAASNLNTYVTRTIPKGGAWYSWLFVLGSTAVGANCVIRPYVYPVLDPINDKDTTISNNFYTVNLNDTYYGGSVDLATGLMTVTWASHVFDGTENFGVQTYTNIRRFQTTSPVFPSSYVLTSNIDYEQKSTHLVSSGSNSENSSPHFYIAPSTGNVVIFSTETTNDGLKAWLASQYNSGTPLIMLAKYVVPPTVQLTPQQIKSLVSLEGTSKRINTLYTDADSIQVEYQKYVGVDSTLDNTSENAIQNKVVNSALNTKVSLTGDEVIAGSKTFSSPINGSVIGDAGTVAGHIVSKDVPVNAAFTDTTYEPATQSTAGLMSASDKIKLDAVGSVFTFKGSVVNSSSLPASDNVNGDAYLAEDTGHVHVYDGTNFVDIGTWAGIPSATDAQIDALFED